MFAYFCVRNGDIELQNPMNNGVVHQEELQPSNNDNLYDKGWNYLFLSSFVIAAIVDPLLFYIPVINDGMRCLLLEKKLRTAVYVFRTVSDFIYVVHIVLRRFFKKHGETSSNSSVEKGVRRKYISYPIDFFVILPIPQVRVAFLK